MRLESIKQVGISLLAATLIGVPLSAIPMTAHAETMAVQQSGVVKGVVKSETGELLIGAVVYVVGTQINATTDVDGTFTLKGVKSGATVRVQLVGYEKQDIKWTGGALDVTLKEMANTFNEAVVTAMGIVRKEKSLTYATQQIKADELMKVQDANLVNSMEGKISGVTITPSSGGAGGASKIVLRGNKSILGNNQPLIVVDGIPMTNNTRGQIGDVAALVNTSTAEGSDPLSMINPDDIESMNVLKGANAAALYGSAAANGVIMITTKKGKEGKIGVTFNSNVTFDSPLLTPELQNRYGGVRINALGNKVFGSDSWGAKLDGKGKYTLDVLSSDQQYKAGSVNRLRLRNYAANDIEDFYRTGVNTNNSVSVSGGTEKVQSYVSFSNAHSLGMIEANNYNRNTFAFRQSYKLWDRVHIDVSADYLQTKTNNRISGGTCGNPVYDLYTMPRDVDLAYYKDNYVADGTWMSSGYTNIVDDWGDVIGQQGGDKYYVSDPATGQYREEWGRAELTGPMQQWVYQDALRNNPYWLAKQNKSTQREDRFSAKFQGRVDIYDGLAFQARVSIDHTKYNEESRRYATTWGPSDMYRYGTYSLGNSRSNEIYTDYLLSYNKTFKDDWSVSATAGWVGHTITGQSQSTYLGNATIPIWTNGMTSGISTVVNYFSPDGGGNGVTSKGKSSNWDKAALFTAQLGWRDMIYIDGSYRRDWYRAFKQFEYLGVDDNYGYFGFGANAILTSLFQLPEWISYAKYRISYSEVGNSIPNAVFNAVKENFVTGSVTTGSYNTFLPIPEKTKSFETGLETQFFHNAMNLDITYYNSAMHNSYLNISGLNGKTQPVNSGLIRNQGVELSVGYNWTINRDWGWKTNVNFSYNHNKIEKTYTDKFGQSKEMVQSIASGKVQIRYNEGDAYGDIYVTDFARWKEDVKDANGNLIHKAGDIYIAEGTGKPAINGNLMYITQAGKVKAEKGKKFGKYAGNMNADYQLSWSNNFRYKNFNLYILINGRIGGKVISLTEAYLDRFGVSKRTGDARAKSEKLGLYTADGRHAMYINEGRDLVSVEDYYTAVGSSDASSYIYNGTNFRLREVSLGYTFRDLLGEGKNLSLSVIGRNLFFIYKDAPVDPDISVSTANGLGGIDMFNVPSSRSFGVNLKLNF
ncbi:MAG: SusC/RagA family TonB-linked outer membrane protein [Bacteroidaceae bacterium]|nr:SusC/RagA family TonB-linked outer membrane protein [Bacteroidaceae bacterium]